MSSVFLKIVEFAILLFFIPSSENACRKLRQALYFAKD